MENLEKSLVPGLITTVGFTYLLLLERNAEFSVSKGDDACHLWKLVRNPNIPVAPGKGRSVSRLISRGVTIALQSLEENSQVSFATRQES